MSARGYAVTAEGEIDGKAEIRELLRELKLAYSGYADKRALLLAELNDWLKEDGYTDSRENGEAPLCVAGELIPPETGYYTVRRRAAITGIELRSVKVCATHAHVYPLTSLGA